MKKLLTFSTLALALTLSACATPSAPPGSEVSQVQTTTEKLCGYVPAAGVVANILAAASGQGAVAGIGPIAQAICNAMLAKRDTQALISGCPSVNDVCIEGEWKER